MQLMLRPHEMSADWGVVPVRHGQTIAEMLRQAAGTDDVVPVQVRINGVEVPAELWPRVHPKAGTVIHVTPLVLHGGSARRWLVAIVMLVVAFYSQDWGSALAAWSAIGTGTQWASAIMLVASLAAQALIPPPSPGGGSSGTEGQWHQLTGTQNQINPWGAIPCVLGESRFFPPHAALPYTRNVGENSYQHCLFDLGHGDIEVSDIKIGDTPLSQYEDVRWEITRTPTLYLNDVAELYVGAGMNEPDTVTRTTSPQVDEISLDVVFQQGLFFIDSKGRDRHLSTSWQVRYRPVGSSTWLPPPEGSRLSGFAGNGGNFIVHALRKKPFSAGIAWGVDPGQYEVQLTRLTGQVVGDKDQAINAATWSVLRSVRHTAPSTTGTNKLALVIRANDQVNGTLQTLSCMVKQRVPVWTGGAWVTQATTNPAWVAWWVMTQCPATARHAPASRLSLDGWAEYAQWCDDKGLACRMVADSTMTVREVIQRVLNGSLATLGARDGRYFPVFDHGETLPSFTFTPEEISDFKVSRVFGDIPHALKVQFVNVEAEWQQDEVVVLADGYSHRGMDARGNPSSDPQASVFEDMRIEQAMAPQQAWQVARFHLAQGKYRPNTYAWDSDISGVGVVRGDVVDVMHDVAEWGDGFGRVLAVEAGGIAGAAATVTLDQATVTDATKQYGMQVRHGDGSRSVVNIVAAGGETAVFALESAAGIQPGDMAVIGLRGRETAKLLIKDVRYSADFATSFTAVEYDPRVTPYWANPPEVMVSEISGRQYGLPEEPVIIGVVSDPTNDERDDAGIPRVNVHVGIQPRESYDLRLFEQER